MNVYDNSMVWSYKPKLFCFVFPKKLSTKANNTLHRCSHKIHRSWLKIGSLTLNHWDLKPMEKLRQLLLYFHIQSYCFNQAGKYLLYLLPLARPENALGNVIDGFRWQQAQNTVMSHQCYNVIRFSASVRKFYFRYRLKLPESLFFFFF